MRTNKNVAMTSTYQQSPCVLNTQHSLSTCTASWSMVDANPSLNYWQLTSWSNEPVWGPQAPVQFSLMRGREWVGSGTMYPGSRVNHWFLVQVNSIGTSCQADSTVICHSKPKQRGVPPSPRLHLNQFNPSRGRSSPVSLLPKVPGCFEIFVNFHWFPLQLMCGKSKLLLVYLWVKTMEYDLSFCSV